MNRWHCPSPLPHRAIAADRTGWLRRALPLLGVMALALAGSVTHAQVAPASAWVSGTGSQPKRSFPPSAQRAQMTVLNAHEVSMNGKTVRLSPGSRIRSPSNALLLSGNLVGQSFLVNHVRDTLGQVHEVWLLNDAEAAERRPGSEGVTTTNLTNSTP